MPAPQRQRLLEELGDEGCLRLKYDWPFWARENQLYPIHRADWNIWTILAGRGFGKTRMGSEAVRYVVEQGLARRIALVAEDAGDARDVMIEGDSGLLSCSPPWFRPHFEPSKKRLTWPNGATATYYSSDDPESLRGPQFDFAWCDELAKWRYAQETWDMLQFGMRLGSKPRQIITTTPRPTALLKGILASPDTYITKGSTNENIANLASNFVKSIVDKYAGTRLGRQELEAEMLLDNPYALWKMEQLDAHRIKIAPEDLVRVAVAVDPPIEMNGDSDECGIVVGGVGRDGRGYLLADLSVQGASPSVWAKRAATAYEAFSADFIVGEANQGGAMVGSTLAIAAPNAPIKLVKASRGKVARAEPISLMYERGVISHVGSFPRLEDQMCEFTSNFDRNTAGYSPDRVDALVWLWSELFPSVREAEPRARSL